MDLRNFVGWTRVHPNDLRTIDGCKTLVSKVFEAISERYGQDRARNIFSPYGRPLTKRQIKLDSDAALLLKCDEMKPLNVRKLAMHLARASGKDRGAIERKIWRVLKDKRVRHYLEYLQITA